MASFLEALHLRKPAKESKPEKPELGKQSPKKAELKESEENIVIEKVEEKKEAEISQEKAFEAIESTENWDQLINVCKGIGNIKTIFGKSFNGADLAEAIEDIKDSAAEGNTPTVDSPFINSLPTLFDFQKQVKSLLDEKEKPSVKTADGKARKLRAVGRPKKKIERGTQFDEGKVRELMESDSVSTFNDVIKVIEDNSIVFPKDKRMIEIINAIQSSFEAGDVIRDESPYFKMLTTKAGLRKKVLKVAKEALVDTVLTEEDMFEVKEDKAPESPLAKHDAKMAKKAEAAETKETIINKNKEIEKQLEGINDFDSLKNFLEENEGPINVRTEKAYVAEDLIKAIETVEKSAEEGRVPSLSSSMARKIPRDARLRIRALKIARNVVDGQAKQEEKEEARNQKNKEEFSKTRKNIEEIKRIKELKEAKKMSENAEKANELAADMIEKADTFEELDNALRKSRSITLEDGRQKMASEIRKNLAVITNSINAGQEFYAASPMVVVFPKEAGIQNKINELLVLRQEERETKPESKEAQKEMPESPSKLAQYNELAFDLHSRADNLMEELAEIRHEINDAENDPYFQEFALTRNQARTVTRMSEVQQDLDDLNYLFTTVDDMLMSPDIKGDQKEKVMMKKQDLFFKKENMQAELDHLDDVFSDYELSIHLQQAAKEKDEKVYTIAEQKMIKKAGDAYRELVFAEDQLKAQKAGYKGALSRMMMTRARRKQENLKKDQIKGAEKFVAEMQKEVDAIEKTMKDTGLLSGKGEALGVVNRLQAQPRAINAGFDVRFPAE